MPQAPPTGPTPARSPGIDRTAAKGAPLSYQLPDSAQVGSTAVVYCEGNFGAGDGKTANGLVRHSEKYEILSVIDSEKAGLDAGEVLGDEPNGIPDLLRSGRRDRSGRARPRLLHLRDGALQRHALARRASRAARCHRRGMHIVNGLHEFLNDDPEFAAAAAAHNVTILDVRRPREKKNLRMFSGHISTVTCPRIAVLGTDSAIGKRTTATILTRALNDCGIKAVFVGTGQTGLIQGARYGVALDAIPCQFCSGEMEAAVVEAYEGEHPDVIVIEGQGALSHPAYLSSSFILRGSQPHAVILQHAPARKWLGDFADVPMPTAASEIALIEILRRHQGHRPDHQSRGHDRRRGHAPRSRSTSSSWASRSPTRSRARPIGCVEMVLRAFPGLRRKLVPATP